MINFVIGGAQKSGTTALSTFVASHPQVAFASPKATHFFDRNGPYAERNHIGTGERISSGAVAESYRQYFEVTRQTVAVGESTPIYMYWDQCPARIHAYDPNMKWIVILRNPVDRAYSHWAMAVGCGTETLNFADALVAEDRRLSKTAGQHRHWSYAARGRYSWQLQRLFKLFGHENVLILLNEDLAQCHRGTLDRIWDFLSVERIDVTQQRLFTRQYPDMGIVEHRYLTSRFAPEVDQLEAILDRTLSTWRQERRS